MLIVIRDENTETTWGVSSPPRIFDLIRIPGPGIPDHHWSERRVTDVQWEFGPSGVERVVVVVDVP